MATLQEQSQGNDQYLSLLIHVERLNTLLGLTMSLVMTREDNYHLDLMSKAFPGNVADSLLQSANYREVVGFIKALDFVGNNAEVRF